MMKKWLFWFLMTVVLLGLAACNSAPAVSDDSGDVTTTTASSAATTTTTASIQPMVYITTALPKTRPVKKWSNAVAYWNSV